MRATAADSARMPWGKHQGEPLAEIPTYYLQWVLDNCEAVSHGLRKAIVDEMDERGVWQPEHEELPFEAPRPVTPAEPIVQEVGIDPLELNRTFVAWYRKMASLLNADEREYAALNLMAEELSKDLHTLFVKCGLPSHTPRLPTKRDG